ncbi:hypothetical protein KFK09_015500 [Dendrobium nobile]|uniref:Uncharacterized protein n=1 Tax=Dendrobium nobile TaxID=94219 RepID=A0A8T3B650_DENNO|nr:hypothetical protein KFK09_015500 [Dendrobium nobile]
MAAKHSSISFLLLILIVFASVEMMVPKVEAQKRCQVILDPNSCNLPVCREECFKRKKNGFGECISNTAGTAYACYCFYDC